MNVVDLAVYFQICLLGIKTKTMDILTVRPVLHKDYFYFISNETPENGDMVYTEKYGVWEFKDETGQGSAPMPYWANKNACKKIIASTDRHLHLPLIPHTFIAMYWRLTNVREVDVRISSTRKANNKVNIKVLAIR